MKITKEEILQRQQQANNDNNVGWLDKAKMESKGINANPMKLTGYVRPENPFRECQTKKPYYGF